MATDLFDDFPKQDFADWKAKIQKDLKGKDFQSLVSETEDGISIQPIYHPDNFNAENQPFKSKVKWDKCQELFVADEKAANREALDHLNRGATSLLFYLYGNADLEVLLKDILIEHIRINFVVEGDAEILVENFKNLIQDRNLEEVEIAGSLNIYCLENLARTGNWFQDEKSDLKRIQNLNEKLPHDFRGICINVNLFANAGATLAQQLGISLAMIYEYVHRLELQNANSFWVNFAVGSDYFGEIAKLRAFRRLWDFLLQELEVKHSEPFIYTETALRNKTIKDGYNNMIRTTSETMAAIIGGANEISVKGFNHTFKEPDFFGERIAKNQQSILEHESHFDEISDLAQGSYFIENLTEELCKKGWQFFKEIEAQNGYVESLKNGWLQNEIKNSAKREQKSFDEKSKVLIGANVFSKEDEDLKKVIEMGMFFRESGKETLVKALEVRRLAEEVEK